MNITFEREGLLRPLTYVTGVVERRQTVPVLSYVLLRSESDGLTLTGTDLETEVVVSASGETNDRTDLTLPARKLLDICRALPEDAKITIRTEGEKAVVRTGRSRFTLRTLPSSDFPSIQTTDWDLRLSVDAAALRQVLSETQFCMAQQDVRYYLNGVLLEVVTGALRAVATDGHRMALSQIPAEGKLTEGRQVIMPRKAVLEISRILGDTTGRIELLFSPNHVRVQAPGLTFTAKLIDGRYPDYSKVLPARQSKRLLLDREALRVALNRVAILSNEKFRGARLVLEPGILKFVAHNPEQEEAQDELSVEYSGEPMEVGFNVSYLIDATSALNTEKVVVGLNDPNSSCLIHGPDQEFPRYVVMPMRL
ncbi:MAG: DNA polymerase III subunit beta [Pseudomonadota bacterium]|nr:MAG: DNA polymerase III subunit beta [Pseudomonadota bacterium]